MIQIPQTILAQVIKKRSSQSHKGDYGRILLIGGTENYGGAIIMAAEGALKSGAGLVSVATHSQNLSALHARDPEIMFIDWHQPALEEILSQMDVIVCGPGLGQDDFAQRLLKMLQAKISAKQTLILDASALDILAQKPALLPLKAGLTILTPHQMEWQRLSQLRISYQTDQANKEALMHLFPAQNGILVLKSNHTKVYDCAGQCFVNPLGNPGMAVGGMGDTLAGIIGGFTAQFEGKLQSVLAAVYLHSLAGDQLAKDDYIVRPTMISELLPQLMKKYAQ